MVALREPERECARSVLQLQVGENTCAIFVREIGLDWSFSRSVTAKAAAVPASRPTTITIETTRAKAGRV